MAGLGQFLTRQRPAPAQQHARTITEFAIIDGQRVFGSGATGRYRGVMSIPGAWRASTVLCDLLGQVPWHGYRERAGQPIERLSPTPPLLERPAPPDTRMATFSSWALDLIHDGNAIGVIAARNAEGWPTAVLPVPASMVGVRRVTPLAYSALPVGAIEYAIGELRLGVHDVIHIKGLCEPGALRGMGVLEAHLTGTLELAQEQARQAATVSRHGVPTGVLRATDPTVEEDELRDTKEAWLRSQRERTVAALGAGVEFEPLSWNPDELQLVEARKFSLHEIALVYGLPLYFLGVEGGSNTYSNLEQEGLNLIKFSLSGHLARFEQTLSLHMPYGTSARANLDAILRADTLARYQAHAIGISAGFLLVDEARELENRPPLPEPEPEPEPPAPPPPAPAVDPAAEDPPSPEEGADDE